MHLHPQWIVEFGRLLILINKEIGTKFLISSHSPDMISAIKYISEKEGTSKNINFYLAERKDNKFLYEYKHLKSNIEEIFESFNISFEKLDKYGKYE